MIWPHVSENGTEDDEKNSLPFLIYELLKDSNMSLCIY
jgi:hypothetical protein